MERWVEAIYNCKPVIISDTESYKDSNPDEYELYKRCHADSVLAVPFWKNPIGFMLVRNPKKYCTDEYETGFLQALAFVAFSAITEKKLIQRTQKAFSPDAIQKDTDVIVNLLGNLEIYTSRGVLTEAEISSPRICRFLVYMLLHGKYPVQPRMIQEEIWPDEDVETAGNKIKSLAYRFKTVFELISDYRLIVSTPNGYQLNPELNIKTDIQQFDDLWSQAQCALTLQTKEELLKKAAKLYRGNIYDIASYEHWLIPHEMAYKYKCLSVYIELMSIYYESQDYTTVEYYASLALKIEDASVDAHYWKIRALRQKNSLSMAKAELKIAEYAMTPEEYEELCQKLNRTGEMVI